MQAYLMILASPISALRGADSETTSALNEIVTFLGSSQRVWQGSLIFARIGAVLMIIPGIGEAVIPPRMRLAFTFVLTLLLIPVLANSLPPIPSDLAGTVFGLVHEVLIGLMLGTLIRVFISALAVAGEIISLQTTLSFAQTANPAQAQSSTSIGTFLALLGLVLVYAMNLHHMFIKAMIDSYTLFPTTKPIMLQDATSLMIRTVSQAFSLALQISAPVIVFAMVFNIATGFVGRIMPSFPVFFAATPLSVLLGLSVLALSLGVTGLVFIGHYQEFINLFLVRSQHG